MVCIMHFTKWVELIPLPSKPSKNSARRFLEGVRSRYKAPKEMLTNLGHEFMGEFQHLLTQHENTHALASGEHPESNGLVERMVHTMKRALRKCLLDGGGKDWDEVFLGFTWQWMIQFQIMGMRMNFLLQWKNHY